MSNLGKLIHAVEQLGDLADELVFVGGCTTELFITDKGSDYVRPTIDVDAIVQAVTYVQFTDFERRLRAAGFSNDTSEGAPICRWRNGETLLDIMPVDGTFLGFNSKWYAEAVDAAILHEIKEGSFVKAVSPPYFLATKLEAFVDRGKNDHLGSRDLEDIITIINGRKEIVEEMAAAEGTVRTYVGRTLGSLLGERGFIDSLPGHLNPDPERIDIVHNRLEELSRLSTDSDERARDGSA